MRIQQIPVIEYKDISVGHFEVGQFILKYSPGGQAENKTK